MAMRRTRRVRYLVRSFSKHGADVLSKLPFDVIELWATTGRDSVLKMAGIHTHTTDPSNVSPLEWASVWRNASRRLTARLGDGVPGRLAARQGAEWESNADLLPSASFRRACLARKCGIKTVFGVGVVAAGSRYAVLFLSRKSFKFGKNFQQYVQSLVRLWADKSSFGLFQDALRSMPKGLKRDIVPADSTLPPPRGHASRDSGDSGESVTSSPPSPDSSQSYGAKQRQFERVMRACFENAFEVYLGGLPFHGAELWTSRRVGVQGDGSPKVEIRLCAHVPQDSIGEQWAEFSERFVFQDGQSFIGRVFSSGESEWHTDVGAVKRWLCLRGQGARRLGIRTVFGTRVTAVHGARPVVLMMYSTKPLPYSSRTHERAEAAARSWVKAVSLMLPSPSVVDSADDLADGKFEFPSGERDPPTPTLPVPQQSENIGGGGWNAAIGSQRSTDVDHSVNEFSNEFMNEFSNEFAIDLPSQHHAHTHSRTSLLSSTNLSHRTTYPPPEPEPLLDVRLTKGKIFASKSSVRSPGSSKQRRRPRRSGRSFHSSALSRYAGSLTSPAALQMRSLSLSPPKRKRGDSFGSDDTGNDGSPTRRLRLHQSVRAVTAPGKQMFVKLSHSLPMQCEAMDFEHSSKLKRSHTTQMLPRRTNSAPGLHHFFEMPSPKAGSDGPVISKVQNPSPSAPNTHDSSTNAPTRRKSLIKSSSSLPLSSRHPLRTRPAHLSPQHRGGSLLIAKADTIESESSAAAIVSGAGPSPRHSVRKQRSLGHTHTGHPAAIAATPCWAPLVGSTHLASHSGLSPVATAVMHTTGASKQHVRQGLAAVVSENGAKQPIGPTAALSNFTTTTIVPSTANTDPTKTTVTMAHPAQRTGTLFGMHQQPPLPGIDRRRVHAPPRPPARSHMTPTGFFAGFQGQSRQVNPSIGTQPLVEFRRLENPGGDFTEDGKKRKRFQCLYCNKQFVQRSNMVAHVRIHTGEKPYVCAICNRGFAQKSNLKRHTKVHNATQQ